MFHLPKKKFQTMTSIKIHIVDKNSKQVDDHNKYIKLFQKWWYPDHKNKQHQKINGLLFPIYIVDPHDIQLQYLDQNWLKDNIVFEETCMTYSFLTILNKKECIHKDHRKPFKFDRQILHRANIVGFCEQTTGFLSS